MQLDCLSPRVGCTGYCNDNCEKICLVCPRLSHPPNTELRPQHSGGHAVGVHCLKQKLNENAYSIGELISWSEDVSEPPLTCILNTSELKDFINTPMEVLTGHATPRALTGLSKW